MSLEPGLDRHEWESEWESIVADAEDSPEEALPLLDDLILRMLSERGFAPLDPVDRDGDDPEVFADFRAAHDVTRRLEQGLDVDPEDVSEAIKDYREVFEFLVEERGAP
jgi:hypothetical protein